jgi:hypothetical protein
MHSKTHRWVAGDQFGMAFPADPAALRSGGAGFLSDAFRASGMLASDNTVTTITDFREVAGGSTGRKVVLSVEYDRPQPGLHRELFVKFSRDFDNPTRDRGKTQVPSVQFGDYHRPTATGILITGRIRYGDNGIERQYHKCLDYQIPAPVEHYRALLTALARLAGTHRSGRLPARLTAHFPLDVQSATVGQRSPLRMDKLDRRLPRARLPPWPPAGTAPGRLDRGRNSRAAPSAPPPCR